MSLTKVAILILSVFFSFGCSRFDIALKFADTVALYSVDDYFDLSPKQRDQFRDEFNVVLKDIEKKDFPLLVDFLEQIAKSAEDKKIELVSVQKYFEEGSRLFKKGAQRFEPLAQRLVDEQSKQGFAMFDKEFSEKLAKDVEEAQNQRRFYKKTKAKYEKWVDETIEDLTSQQEAGMEQQLKDNPPPKVSQINSRKSVHEKFKVLRGDDKKRKEFISQFFSNWDSFQSESYLAERNQYQKKLVSWVYELSQTLTDKQRKNLSENLRQRAATLRKLSAKP